MIIDQQQRQLALEVRHSFIVQAPAGSGKTELLTQRFLKLLSCVNEPEEIVAMTFTRRAAAEMRQRILHALRQCDVDVATSPHQKITQSLARSVCKRNNKLSWGLLKNASRLRITTIDAFAASLCKQLPTITHLGNNSQVMDKPQPLYQLAATRLLAESTRDDELTKPMGNILQYYDNKPDRLLELIVYMLPRRDQWLRHVVSGDGEQTKQYLENSLRNLVTEKLQSIKQHFNDELLIPLLNFLQIASATLSITEPSHALSVAPSIHDLNEHFTADHLTLWQAIADWLLTKDGRVKQNITRKMGFLPPSEPKIKAEEKQYRKQLNEQLRSFLKCIESQPQLIEQLIDIRCLPPCNYQAAQWEVLSSLCALLPRAVAQLHVVFSEKARCDFVHINMQAQQALGHELNPSELALQLDYKIQHLLIDECQDTSYLHYQFMTLLVSGWQEHDGKSIFLVGDPMQSIYRFRDAEVGLFLQMQHHGIANIRLQSLTLSSNFRTQSDLLSWINHQCSHFFAAENNILQAAIAYTPANAVIKALQESPLNCQRPQWISVIAEDQKEAETKEACSMISIIKNIQQAAASDSIAILVRARHHLTSLCKQLQAEELSYVGIDISSLAHHACCKDLLTLTRALSQPADDVAWYGVLRAPWCGLQNNTLLELSEAAKQSACSYFSQWLLAQTPEHLNQLNITYRHDIQALTRCLDVLQHSLATQGSHPLSTWIAHTWMHLGGPASVIHESDLDSCDAFFNTVDHLDDKSGIIDCHELERRLASSYVNSPVDHLKENIPPIQLMTIHKSKGLEFDHVFLPALTRSSASLEKPILRWLERPHPQRQGELILAPLPAADDAKGEPIYNYLQQLENTRHAYEKQRLLYVAITRAKKQLYCGSHHIIKEDADRIDSDFLISSIRSRSLASLLKDDLLSQFKITYLQDKDALTIKEYKEKHDFLFSHNHQQQQLNPASASLYRISPTWQMADVHPLAAEKKESVSDPVKKPFINSKKSLHDIPCEDKNRPQRLSLQQQIGIIIHAELAQLATGNKNDWRQRLHRRKKYWRAQLRGYVAEKNKINEQIEMIYQTLWQSIHCPRGQWILSSTLHASAFCEQAISVKQQQTIQQQNNIKKQHQIKEYIIDRTFISKDLFCTDGDNTLKRFIIDYKCTMPQHDSHSLPSLQTTSDPLSQSDHKKNKHTLNQLSPLTSHRIDGNCLLQYPAHLMQSYSLPVLIDFIKQQLASYTKQLHTYAQAYRHMENNLPIVCALYFPLLQCWCQWPYKNVLPVDNKAELASSKHLQSTSDALAIAET